MIIPFIPKNTKTFGDIETDPVTNAIYDLSKRLDELINYASHAEQPPEPGQVEKLKGAFVSAYKKAMAEHPSLWEFTNPYTTEPNVEPGLMLKIAMQYNRFVNLFGFGPQTAQA